MGKFSRLLIAILIAVSSLSSTPSYAGASYGTPFPVAIGGTSSTVGPSALTINAISDSEFGNAGYYQPNATYSSVPARAISTALVVGNLVQNGGYTYRVTTAGTTSSDTNGPSSSASVGTLTAGSGYTNGTYTNVTLTGGTCTTPPVATIVVSGTVVSSVSFTNRGLGCSLADSLTTANTNIGGTGTGFAYVLSYIGISSSIQDGTVVYAYMNSAAMRYGVSVLEYVQEFSLGHVRWNMEAGYQGPLTTTVKGYVLAAGVNYSNADTWASTGSSGASGGFTVNSAGNITGVTVTNPGYSAGIHSYTITTSTGSGASLGFVVSPSGTFSVNGANTADMLIYSNDCAASTTDIVVVKGGANDMANFAASAAGLASQYPITIANLAAIYQQQILTGKKVVILPITPRTGMNQWEWAFRAKVNSWERAYVAKQPWANPNGYGNIVIADATRFWQDGTSTIDNPIGGSTAPQGAMTTDGLHESPRGAQYEALAIIDAIQPWVGKNQTAARGTSMTDAYDDGYNQGGNLIEATNWQASTAYTVNQTVMNSGNVYYCFQAGTSASSGGPTGTGGGITDGTAHWNYSRPQGTSVMAGTAVALSSPPSGITYAGNLSTGYTLSRSTGTGQGTVTGTIENPWSDGQIGQRQALAFSLGSGAAGEMWIYTLNSFGSKAYGIPASEVGVGAYYVEAEIELSGVANLTQLRLYLQDGTSGWTTENGFNSAGATHLGLMSTSGEMYAVSANASGNPYPTNGRIFIQTQPVVLTGNSLSIAPHIALGFDASGGAGTATATVKINWLAIRKYNPI